MNLWIFTHQLSGYLWIAANLPTTKDRCMIRQWSAEHGQESHAKLKILDRVKTYLSATTGANICPSLGVHSPTSVLPVITLDDNWIYRTSASIIKKWRGWMKGLNVQLPNLNTHTYHHIFIHKKHKQLKWRMYFRRRHISVCACFYNDR